MKPDTSKTEAYVQDFTTGIKELTRKFKADSQALTDACQGFESHTNAKDMTQLTHQLTLDIQALYKNVLSEFQVSF